MSIRGQARRQIRVIYDPQYDELDSVLEQAKQTVRSGTRAERQVARMLIRQARAARPEVRADYRQAERSTRRADRIVDRDIGEIPAIYRAAIMGERASGATQAANQQRREFSELRGRQLRARDAQVFNTRALRQDFRGTKAEVQEGRAKLARDESNALGTLIEQLRAEQADRAMEQAKFDLDVQKFGLDQRKFGHDAAKDAMDFATDLLDGKGGKGKDGGLTYAQRRDRTADIAKARAWLLKLRAAGLSLPRARDAIVQGRIPRKEGADITLDIPAQYVDAALRDLRRDKGGVQGFFNRLGQSFR